jgi:RNA polymerase sigma-70 factor (ECF subfamily)
MSDLNNLPDERLIELLRNSDQAAFEEIYNRYWAKLYSSAYKRVRLKEVAEEIVQDFFTGLWVNRNKIYIQSSLINYLETAIRYQVFNYFQKEYVRRNYRQSVGLTLNDTVNSTEETILVNDLNRNVDNAIQRLPSKCRSVFELSRKGNKSNKEIGKALGISEKTVENHLTKALKRLRLSLNQLLFTTLFLYSLVQLVVFQPNY